MKNEIISLVLNFRVRVFNIEKRSNTRRKIVFKINHFYFDVVLQIRRDNEDYEQSKK